MENYIALIFLVLGTIGIFVASLGLLKMPDIFLRMSASTIGGTFGVASMLISVAIYFGELRLILHILGVIIFLILTVPVGAHMIGRTAHFIGLKKWDKTTVDDLEGKYERETTDSNEDEA